MAHLKRRITYRSIRPGDFEFLEDIITEAWWSDQWGREAGLSRAFSRAYLNNCLSQGNFNRVALCGSRPVGLIIGRSGRRPLALSARRRLALFLSQARLMSYPAGRRLARSFRRWGQADAALLKGCKRSFDGELVLLVTAREARGMGIGTGLLKRLFCYFKKTGVRRFFLFTDTKCCYSFYDKRGFKRLAQCRKTFPPAIPWPVSLFLYEYDLAAPVSHAGPAPAPSPARPQPYILPSQGR